MPDSWDIRMSMQRPAAPPPPGAVAPRPAPVPAASRRLVPVRRARRGSRTVMVLGFIAVVAVTAAAASIAWKLTTPEPSEPASSASGAEPEAAPPPAPPSPQPTVTATASASAAKPAPAPPVPADTAACFATMLPEKAFGHFKPKLDRLCTDTRAYNTMLYLKAAIVRAGGSMAVTPAMDEWSKLGWFETAAFAAMRAHCCPDAKALNSGGKLGRCKMDEALAYIANAVDDDARMKEATEHYALAARCVALAGGGFAWGRYSAPYGGEEVFFNRVYDRMKKARGR